MHSRAELTTEEVEEAKRRQAEQAPDAAHEPFLALQRSSGNAAVARMLQRAPKDRPASTDAPGAHPGHDKAPPKAVADIHARILKVDIDDNQTLITIGSGSDQGVQVGMSGSLVSSSGKELADFTIESVQGRLCKAHVHAIPDQVNANPEVVIKPSSLEDQHDKGF